MNDNILIRNTIIKMLEDGISNFIIYPFGEMGVKAKEILNTVFGIKEMAVIDNTYCRYNPDIHSVSYLNSVYHDDFGILFCCKKYDGKMIDEIGKITKNIYVVFEQMEQEKQWTRCGKHSYGPLVNHFLVESVGAFCSFAPGCDAVVNHPMKYVTMSPIMYQDKAASEIRAQKSYEDYKEKEWYIKGIKPHGEIEREKRIKIGNDVWIGKNALITNYANIGNGAVIGAGAIVTKDIPDYAIAVGVPARIIRYRFTEEQINALNIISWWDWPDEQIRERYEDFYDINLFIKKYS